MGATEQGINPERWSVIPRTLCFITSGNDVLLMERGMHKRVFPGRYNGIGGHVERGEDALVGALREIEEETGLRPEDLTDIRLRGVTMVDSGEQIGVMLFVFSMRAKRRDVPKHNEEGALHWVPLDQVLTLPVVEDVPPVLRRLFGPQASDLTYYGHLSYDAADRMVIQFTDTPKP